MFKVLKCGKDHECRFEVSLLMNERQLHLEGLLVQNGINVLQINHVSLTFWPFF